MGFYRPEWEYKYDRYEYVIAHQTNVSKEQLREVVRLMKEYEILPIEGKAPGS